ncbi:MAG: primosomal protein N' [Gammaproteobacteria bacterium]|nr:MAG: primosomal protein N' [Gammaproteobacteria bacterium]
MFHVCSDTFFPRAGKGSENERVKVGAMTPSPVLRVAVPVPLRRLFDYLPPSRGDIPAIGARIRVPFGRRQLVGLVVAHADSSAIPLKQLKAVLEAIDKRPLLSESLMKLMHWSARYYHHAPGEVFLGMLPAFVRRGRPAEISRQCIWRISESGRALNEDALRRAPLQRTLLQALTQTPAGLNAAQLADIAKGWRAAMKSLMQRGWAEETARAEESPATTEAIPGPGLNDDQLQAVNAITGSLECFRRWLLFGVTGSGKTEVYIEVMSQVIAAGKQVLVLVPEIGLTSQLVNRVKTRLGVTVAVMHSGLNDSERLHSWMQAHKGMAQVVLGTRSAVYAPFRSLGLIVVDEEHDSSFKQQDGFRYHARDVAIVRARDENIPIILGSATPSLESLYQVKQCNYQMLQLPNRTGRARAPKVELIDMRRTPADSGLSPQLFDALKANLGKEEQSLVFLNRRGYAPVYMCYRCGWLAPCPRCDARLIVHQGSRRLRCHHCGADQPIPGACPQCGTEDLHPIGEGTEKLEETLKQRLPNARIARIDRDSTRRKGSFDDLMNKVEQGEIDILVGTQMLAKGHDYHDLTLVAVVNADQGLFSIDFRAPEHMVQQIMQVSGRAGRGDKPGKVLIQTWHPEHVVFDALKQNNYLVFADKALFERRAAQLPPYAHLASLRGEATSKHNVQEFIAQAYQSGKQIGDTMQIELSAPITSVMEKRAGRFRMQILLQSSKRPELHRHLELWLPLLEEMPLAKKVRWSLDVDPMDLY